MTNVRIITKKHLLVLLILIVSATAAIGGLLRRQAQKSRWLEYKQRIENQKAEEITIRVIEGWSNQELGEYLEKQGIAPAADFLKALEEFHAENQYALLPKAAGGDWQGFLYPDTYRLFKSITDRRVATGKEAARTVIGKLLDNFEKKLPAGAEKLAEKQGLSLYEAIILASIVENETGRGATAADDKEKLDIERKTVAGIFYNRLRENMALQSDATINYITGKKDPAPRLADLEVDSPYNTYKHRGLPPTPIGNPSFSSINAALNPVSTDYFYFLHKQPEGVPVYAKTFEEHVKNKLRYLK